VTPIEPPPASWTLPAVDPDGEEELVFVGGDLSAGGLVAAYRAGLFPMPYRGDLGWWCPARRGVLPIDALIVGRSLRKACARFEVRIDTAFDDVMLGCADPDRKPPWITEEVRAAYGELHRLGWAHSVETYTPDGRLVGGLYGLGIGGMFGGESMFHRETDASKVALVALVERLRDGGATLIDVQWLTPHLASLGAIEISRREYLDRLRDAIERPPAFAG
jgi:leucyl/phenylalanyl-tRNA--protein transferase